MRKRIKPAGLVLRVVLVGALLFGVVVWSSSWLYPLHVRLIVGGYLVAWLIALAVCTAVAVVAQASMRKRHGVFSHLNQSSTEQGVGGTARAER